LNWRYFHKAGLFLGEFFSLNYRHKKPYNKRVVQFLTILVIAETAQNRSEFIFAVSALVKKLQFSIWSGFKVLFRDSTFPY